MELSYFGKYCHEKNINEKVQLQHVLLQDKYMEETAQLKSQLEHAQHIIARYQNYFKT